MVGNAVKLFFFFSTFHLSLPSQIIVLVLLPSNHPSLCPLQAEMNPLRAAHGCCGPCWGAWQKCIEPGWNVLSRHLCESRFTICMFWQVPGDYYWRFFFFSLKGRVTGEKERRTEILSSGPLLRWLPQPVLGQDEVKSQQLHLDLPRGHRDPSSWTIFCCCPRCISKEVEQPGLKPCAHMGWQIYSKMKFFKFIMSV